VTASLITIQRPGSCPPSEAWVPGLVLGFSCAPCGFRGCLGSICAWILPVTFRVRERRYHLGLFS